MPLKAGVSPPATITVEDPAVLVAERDALQRAHGVRPSIGNLC
jgi:hypothetical protein